MQASWTRMLSLHIRFARALESSPPTRVPGNQLNRGWVGADALEGVNENSKEAQLVGEANKQIVAAGVKRNAVRLLRKFPHQLQAPAENATTTEVREDCESAWVQCKGRASGMHGDMRA